MSEKNRSYRFRTSRSREKRDGNRGPSVTGYFRRSGRGRRRERNRISSRFNPINPSVGVINVLASLRWLVGQSPFFPAKTTIFCLIGKCFQQSKAQNLSKRGLLAGFGFSRPFCPPQVFSILPCFSRRRLTLGISLVPRGITALPSARIPREPCPMSFQVTPWNRGRWNMGQVRDLVRYSLWFPPFFPSRFLDSPNPFLVLFFSIPSCVLCQKRLLVFPLR